MTIQGYPDPGEGLRLHLNENTGGCSPRVLEAIQRMRTTDVATYPSYPELVRACARHFDVDPDWILLTNGLDEGILMAAVTPRTRMIFLNTPSNPTGRLIPIPDLRRIAEGAPAAVVLVDEAYIEFGGSTFLPELGKYPNVLIGRTFSKAYGLAGMRVGVVIGQPQALDPVRSVTLPFNINAVASAATHAALQDPDFLPRYAQQVHESRERLYEACRRVGLEYWESAANFVLVRVGDPVKVFV